ncbi:cation diffusion facilitator family transporter [Clostridium tarantellae]|uniref:Cation transporter n=1 Tax=Clostridium tarantellae TaxID=39493 RepID=A0A6I1MSN1_9CLOT|nr:cation transporter [Clostridium tarantellae]MPQ45172.1 cation transporter [Clostridium tarantellae]
MIFFDGMYSFVSLILSAISLYISSYMNKKDSEGKFPFGKHILEPVVVAFKSLVIAIMCIYSLIGAVENVISGGNTVEYGVALIYAVISTFGCAFIYNYMKNNGKRLSSELIQAESNQWLMDTILSAGVLIGFILATILANTSLAYINKYIDPLMVIISSIIFLRVPIKTFRDSFKEILSLKADDIINEDINTLVKEIEKEYNFEESITRVSKIGRALRIEIDFIYNDKTQLNNLDEMDYLREKLFKEMNHIKYKKWLNISFTGDRKWAI